MHKKGWQITQALTPFEQNEHSETQYDGNGSEYHTQHLAQWRVQSSLI